MDEPKLKAKLESMHAYVPTSGIPNESMSRMAKLGVVIDDWMEENRLDASAIQCWTSMEQYYGIVPCTLMSMMSNSLMPSACEVDIAGLVGMYSMVLASGKPSAIVDWNNNYGTVPIKPSFSTVLTCPRPVRRTDRPNATRWITRDHRRNVGKENNHGTIVGRLKGSDTSAACRRMT